MPMITRRWPVESCSRSAVRPSIFTPLPSDSLGNQVFAGDKFAEMSNETFSKNPREDATAAYSAGSQAPRLEECLPEDGGSKLSFLGTEDGGT
jgi:hypothetical protein